MSISALKFIIQQIPCKSNDLHKIQLFSQNSNENKYALAKLGDLGEKDEMKALGLFSHEGVSIHPGDKGMSEIANRIFKIM